MDYAMTDGLPYDEFECDCGAPTCRGRVTGNDWCRPELWARYPGGFSPFLQRRIDRVSAELAPPHTAPGAPPRVASRRRPGAGARGPRPIA